jgi:hypothetical protein
MEKDTKRINRDASSMRSLPAELAGSDPKRNSGSGQDDSLSAIENSRAQAVDCDGEKSISSFR